MWAIAKIKNNNKYIFENEMRKKLGKDLKIYQPIIKVEKYSKNKLKKYKLPLVDNYVFCYSPYFENSNFIKKLAFMKGLNNFLDGYLNSQAELKSFINSCKQNEDNEGYITSSFFKSKIIDRAKFMSGPFTNMFFDILKKQKNKFEVLMGNLKVSVSNKEIIYLSH
tara:strand:- start:103 stop:600 length:498 start_codon:yes stop_codon:yes gene_type:complete